MVKFNHRFRDGRIAASSSDIAALSLAAAFVLLTYISLFFFRFAFTDDYALLDFHGDRDINPFLLAHGRPLGGLLSKALFTLFDRIDDARILRLIVLSQAILATLLVHRFAVMNRISKSLALLLAVAFATMPPMQNWLVWSVSVWKFPSLLLSIISVFVAERMIDTHNRPQPYWIAWFAGATLCALMIYQPFAMIAWPLMLLRYLNRNDSRSSRQTCVFVLVFALALLCYFILYKWIFLSLLPIDSQPRGSLVSFSDLPAKIVWFTTGPLSTAFSPTLAHSAPVLTGATTMIILAGLWFRAGSSWQFLKLLFAASFALLISHLPSILSAEFPPLRTQVALSLVVIVLLCLSLSVALARLPQSKALGRLATPITIAACFFLSVFAGTTVVRVTAQPQSWELNEIERSLAEAPLPQHRPIVLVGFPRGTSLTGAYCNAFVELGCASSSVHWGLTSMVRLWMRQQGLEPSRYQLLYVHDIKDKNAIIFTRQKTESVPIPIDAVYLELTKQMKTRSGRWSVPNLLAGTNTR